MSRKLEYPSAAAAATTTTTNCSHLYIEGDMIPLKELKK